MKPIGELPNIGDRVVAYSDSKDDNRAYEGTYERPRGWKYGRLRIEPNRFIIWSFFVKWELADD